MKRLLLIYLILAGTASGMHCLAQEDSVFVENEWQQDDSYYYQNKYKYLDIRLSDEDKLLKIGVQPFKPSETFSFLVFTIHGGFEQKLGTSFSMISEINTVMTWTDEQAFHQVGYSPGIRYYFLKKQEIAHGKSGNNCQGFYGLLRSNNLLGMISFRGEGINTESSRSSQLERYITTSLTPEIGLGFQQRLDYHLYFDASISCSYDILEKDWGLQLNFLFGGIFSYTK